MVKYFPIDNNSGGNALRGGPYSIVEHTLLSAIVYFLGFLKSYLTKVWNNFLPTFVLSLYEKFMKLALVLNFIRTNHFNLTFLMLRKVSFNSNFSATLDYCKRHFLLTVNKKVLYINSFFCGSMEKIQILTDIFIIFPQYQY